MSSPQIDREQGNEPHIRGASHPDLPASDIAFRSLIEHLPIISYEEHIREGEYPESAMIYISPQFTKLTGYTADPYREDPYYFWDTIVHPDDRELVLNEARRTAETGELYRQEFRIVTKSGEVIWVLDMGELAETREDGTQVWVGAEIDITERKLAEQALKDGEVKYRDLVEQLPATIYLMEGKNYDEARFVYLNPQATPMGYREQDYLDDPTFWKKIVHPDDIARVEAESKIAMDAGRPYSLEYREFGPQGNMQWTRDEAHVVETKPDGTRLWQGLTTDITERKEADLQLRETIDLLRQTDRARRGLLAQLVQAEEAERARIAADIHDDSVQALTALGLRLDLLRVRAKGEAFGDDIEGLRQMVEDIVGRLRRLMFDLRPQSLDGEGLASSVGAILERLQQESGVSGHLNATLDIDPPEAVRASAFRMTREALINVQKHARASKVDVEISSKDAGVHVAVEDDGDGFDPESTPEPMAHHIGLDSMRDRAEGAGGWFKIDTERGRGTRVEFWIPNEVNSDIANDRDD